MIGTRSLANPGSAPLQKKVVLPSRQAASIGASNVGGAVAGFTNASTDVVTTFRPAAEEAAHRVDRLLRVFEPVAHVAETVGVEREHRVDVVGRDDAVRVDAAQRARVAADLVGAVGEQPDELEVGMGDDPPEGQPAGVARSPVDDPVGHAGGAPTGAWIAGWSVRSLIRQPSGVRTKRSV